STRRRWRRTIRGRASRTPSARRTRSTPVNERRRITHFALDPDMSRSPVVIVGAGHAGVQAAASLREDGFEGDIVLLSNETALPYQRPPLSKAFLKGDMGLHGLPLRAEAFFCDQRIDLRL